MIMLRNRKRNESVEGSGSGGASARVSYCSSIRMCRCEKGTRRWDWDQGGRDGTGRGGGDERGGGGLGRNALKMNFSVGVSMYSENVTSYW